MRALPCSMMRFRTSPSDLRRTDSPFAPRCSPAVPAAAVACLRVGLEESDEVGSLVRLLHTGEHHLRAGNVLLGIKKVSEQVLLVPSDA